ncbi:hypothetical protein FA13DRAFT_1718725 [Coprinellus micaceus]|uniref:Uncharacterized protein n=1 Tax=Coprinellus micaceus TaxID=71717 RepID=A0A4Y7SD62_COPMI|nr:hypothetical protein FA13DRAFT_1718725 [Coprinellus micaceus]
MGGDVENLQVPSSLQSKNDQRVTVTGAAAAVVVGLESTLEPQPPWRLCRTPTPTLRDPPSRPTSTPRTRLTPPRDLIVDADIDAPHSVQTIYHGLGRRAQQYAFRRRDIRVTWRTTAVCIRRPLGLRAREVWVPRFIFVMTARIQVSLSRLGGGIRVETLFDVDKFESYLANHPNQPLVKYAMKGLREGFWPCYVGEWEQLKKDTKTFGQAMHDAKRKFPDEEWTLFKSDVASAFLNLPAHPIYQLHQAVIVDGFLHIFGVLSLHVYMGDFYGFDRYGNLVWFHGPLRPEGQAAFLKLWTDIGCRWEEAKPGYGQPFKVIGFWLSMDQDRKPQLRLWQRLTGHLNWMLNVVPWGLPAFTWTYRKMSGKMGWYQGVWLNRKCHEYLEWMRGVLLTTFGVSLYGGLALEMVAIVSALLHFATEHPTSSNPPLRLLFGDYAIQYPNGGVRLFDPLHELLPTRWRMCI